MKNSTKKNHSFNHADCRMFEKMHLLNAKFKDTTGNKSIERKINRKTKPFSFSRFVRETPRTKTFINSINHNNKESYFTSISQVKSKSNSTPKKTSITQSEYNIVRDTLSSNADDEDYETFDETESNLTNSTTENKSDESFLSIATHQKHKYSFIEPNEKVSDLGKPLRLFNKNGKPLTDRVGQPLRNILGKPLVHLDDKGCLLSDVYGNQVFNCLGESAIYLTTNLRIPPSEEEPGMPLLDLEKKHILFLYDDKGHPLTDGFGRMLLKASGKPMFGISSGAKVDLHGLKHNEMKIMFGKAPLENFVRRIQIFSNNMKPLTDEDGKLLQSAKVVCNKNGMPVCDETGRPLFFKYGNRIAPPQDEQRSSIEISIQQYQKTPSKPPSVTSKGILDQNNSEMELKLQEHKSASPSGQNDNKHENDCTTKGSKVSGLVVCKKSSGVNKEDPHMYGQKEITASTPNYDGDDDETKIKLQLSVSSPKLKEPGTTRRVSEGKYNSSQTGFYNRVETGDIELLQEKNTAYFHDAMIKHEKNATGEAMVLFNANRKLKSQKSSLNPLIRNERICHRLTKKKPYSKISKTNFVQYFKKALKNQNLKLQGNECIYNDYGMPLKDVCGNLLYDKYGIPLTGAGGKKLSEQARQILRFKLRNIPVLPISRESYEKENSLVSLNCNESQNQFGDPLYDKHGRPRFDCFGKLIYDFYGRPLTDAFKRPLIDGIGRPLMDSDGNVLTSVSDSAGYGTVTDVFGRPIYDKRGRELFDSYGRPRFDIFTSAIYDNCGRPVTDGSGNILFDFMNKPIRPYPEKPLYKNVRLFLPKYIDKILANPSFHLILKYSRSSLKDVFHGPLFDDFGRPLYNNIGKPLYDKYGRPLYDKDGKPLCDCYGRPLSEEIRRSPNDTTSSVVDSLKLLKLTKESSKWMEIKRSQTQATKSTESGVLDDAYVMKVMQPSKMKSTTYTYALTRVTTFSDGRQALEILEAPLSPATAREMHRLPVDNKPMIMLSRRRKIIKRKHRAIGYH